MLFMCFAGPFFFAAAETHKTGKILRFFIESIC